MRGLAAAAVAVLVLVLGAGPATAAPGVGTGPAAGGAARPALPLLAYYYLWFDPSSWNRAKTDYPLAGRYSSDDAAVMRAQVQQARAAGIGGFIVSWKKTDLNDRRLRTLMDVARSENFRLAVIYQGLDFDRQPQPIERVATDMRYFRDAFATDPVFDILDKPLMIWSGTWMFSREEIASALGPVRADLTVLATEKSTAGYDRVDDLVDGDAYYWSSVDPTRDLQFAARLQGMGDAVHQGGGLWLAPFAPGFDARLIGGTRNVDRRDGATLREEYAAAVSSSPDVLGLISWNEFSESTYVEPSEDYGHRYLDVLREIVGAPAAAAAGDLAEDSSDPDPVEAGLDGISSPTAAIAGTVALVAAAVALVTVRRRIARRSVAVNGRRRNTDDTARRGG